MLGRCAVQTSDHPRGRFKGVQNQGAFAVSESSWRRTNGDSLSRSSSRQRIGSTPELERITARSIRFYSSRIFPRPLIRAECRLHGFGRNVIDLPTQPAAENLDKCVTSAGMSSRRSLEGWQDEGKDIETVVGGHYEIRLASTISARSRLVAATSRTSTW